MAVNDLDFDEFEDMDNGQEAADTTSEAGEQTDGEGEIPNVPEESEGDIKDPSELFADDNAEDTTTKGKSADSINKSGKKTTKGKETKAAKEDKKPEPPYEGPRHVTVYGKVLFTEDDPKVSNDDIRQRVYDEFQYHEFLKERTIFSQNRETGALELKVDREKRG